MGYRSKKAYNEAAIEFARKNQLNSNSQIFEGIWTGAGKRSQTTQRAISYEGKTVIIDKITGQIVDFYEGTKLKGLVNLKEIL